MKFDVVVGNPPYDIKDSVSRPDGSKNASSSPVYDLFFYLAKNMSKEKIDLIFPSRWIAGAGKGKALKEFTNDLLNDKHVSYLHLYRNASVVFPSTEIKGGVLYLTYDKNYEGKTKIIVDDYNDEQSSYTGYLNSVNSGVLIPYKELITIYTKIKAMVNLDDNNVQNMVSSRTPFGFHTDFFKNPSKYNCPEIFSEKKNDDDIKILGLKNWKRMERYIPYNYPIPKRHDLIDCWKVFGPYAYGDDMYGEKGPNLEIAGPNVICTETYLVFGNFKTKFEAESFEKYFHTKFFRALVGILKVTQHSTTTYRFVPIQDFTENSDIDWNRSIDEIDNQLYKKYKLDDDEIEFIEHKVESM